MSMIRNHPIMPSWVAESPEHSRFFNEFHEQVRHDWQSMCDRSQAEWKQWLDKNKIADRDFDYRPFMGEPFWHPQSPPLHPPPLTLSDTAPISGNVKNDPSGFSVSLDVSKYAPEELKVTTVGNEVLIEGCHDHREEGPSKRSEDQRHFQHKYLLAEGIKPENVTSKLSANGLLIVSAPGMAPPIASASSRNIPVQKQ